MSGKTEEIAELLMPTVAALGLELLGVEYAPSRSRALLRLYIDVAGGERAVTLDDCEAVSREVSAVLDVEDPISSEYTLEVSSPGIDRPLFTPAQFARFVGESARLNLRLPQDGRRRLQGRIVRVVGDTVVVAEAGQADEERELAVAHGNIEKARLVPDLVALGLAAAPSGNAARGGKPGKGSSKDMSNKNRGGKPARGGA